jgi:hypothetical protein
MIAVAPLALAAALGVFWVAAEYGRERERPEAGPPALSLAPQTAEQAVQAAGWLVPALLTRIYDGFALSHEGAIYDTLAEAAHGEALEALYLARASALAQGGLVAADQEVHEIRMGRIAPRTAGGTVVVDAEWQVVGAVGHGEHVHVRGNTYRAELVIARVNGAWKVTAFDLLDVDRSGAGDLLEAH